MRNFWYLAILTPVTAVPFILLNYLESYPPKSHDWAGFIFLFTVMGIEYLCEVIVAVAILGLLRKESLGKAGWAAAWSTVKTYTWPLLRLFTLIALIFILFALAIVLFGITLGADKIFVLMTFSFFAVLICISVALAAPLVVMENLTAIAALKRSWKMSKSHFWYLTGCLFFLTLGETLLYLGITWPLEGVPWSAVPTGFVTELISTMWLVLTWSMCLRIKKAEARA